MKAKGMTEVQKLWEARKAAFRLPKPPKREYPKCIEVSAFHQHKRKKGEGRRVVRRARQREIAERTRANALRRAEGS